MKLEFVLVPTRDLGAALALYRDGLGLQEAWREGETTVTLALPGTDVQMMIDATDPDAPAGPVFIVDDVRAFHAGRPDGLTAVAEPADIPGGAIALYTDASGNALYVMDQATDAAEV